MGPVGDGYSRFGWPGIVLLYAFISASIAVCSAVAWALRDRPEWPAMLVIIMVSANAEITMATLLSTFYAVLFVFPKYYLLFRSLRIFQPMGQAIRHRRALARVSLGTAVRAAPGSVVARACRAPFGPSSSERLNPENLKLRLW